MKYFADIKPENFDGDIQLQLPRDFPFDRIPMGNDYPFAKGKLAVPFYDYNGYTIWGMTARLLVGNLPLLLSFFS